MLATTLFKFDGVLRSFSIPQMIGEMDFFTVFPNFVILLYQLGTTTSYLTYPKLALFRCLCSLLV